MVSALRPRSKHKETCRQNQQKEKKQKQNEDTEPARRNPLHDLPEWSEEFKENLVDERGPEHTDAPASSSHESALEPLRKMVLGKHSIKTHFAKDRNCEICPRTKITRAPCRIRIGGSVPRAENFGDFDYSRSQSSQ